MHLESLIGFKPKTLPSTLLLQREVVPFELNLIGNSTQKFIYNLEKLISHLLWLKSITIIRKVINQPFITIKLKLVSLIQKMQNKKHTQQHLQHVGHKNSYETLSHYQVNLSTENELQGGKQNFPNINSRQHHLKSPDASN